MGKYILLLTMCMLIHGLGFEVRKQYTRTAYPPQVPFWSCAE